MWTGVDKGEGKSKITENMRTYFMDGLATFHFLSI